MARHKLYARFRANESDGRPFNCAGIMCYRDRCPFWLRGPERGAFPRHTCVASSLRDRGLGAEILLDRFVYFLVVEDEGTPMYPWEE